MSKAILQNDVIDVIYDSICGYPLDKAYEILENHRAGKYIPIEWFNKRVEEIVFAYWTNARNKMTLPLNELPLLIDQIIGEWEKENEKGNTNS